MKASGDAYSGSHLAARRRAARERLGDADEEAAAERARHDRGVVGEDVVDAGLAALIHRVRVGEGDGVGGRAAVRADGCEEGGVGARAQHPLEADAVRRLVRLDAIVARAQRRELALERLYHVRVPRELRRCAKRQPGASGIASAARRRRAPPPPSSPLR